MKYFFLAALVSLSYFGHSQARWFKLAGGVVFSDPMVRAIEVDRGFDLGNGGVGYRVGLTYDQYLDDEASMGFRTGLHLTKKKASIHFETTQSYEEINNTSARLDVDIDVVPIYLVVELPIAFLYKKPLPDANSFFSFTGGASLDLIRGEALVADTNFELFNPQGVPQQFSIETIDNFNFASHLNYSLLMGASYNFLLRNQRYVEFGFSYHFSPVRTDALHITHTINNVEFGSKYQLIRLSYFQLFVSYSLTRLEFNRYL